MNIFLGIELTDAVNKLKAYKDEKETAVDIGNFVCKHYVTEDAEGIKSLDENDISSAFDSMIAKLLSDIDIARAEGQDIPLFVQEDLVKISKAGTYVRYAAYDLIKALKNDHSGTAMDFEQVMIDCIDRKIEEDKVDSATEDEVEKLINETDEIMSTVEDDDSVTHPNNPFYETEVEEGIENASTCSEPIGNDATGNDNSDQWEE